MKVWTVRAGKHGEQEQICLDEKIITIHWTDLPNIKKFKTRDELFEDYQKIYQEDSRKAGNRVGQIWRFANEIVIGDLVALPSKFQPTIHIGKVIGEYKFDKKAKDVIHWRPVEWLATIPRAEFDQDLLYSFGSLLTVSQVSRTGAAERVLELIGGKKIAAMTTETVCVETEEYLNVEQAAKDQIIKLIDRKFKGHKFSELVEEILKAQGYVTQLSPPGADGGLDILAAAGPLGFEPPRICVQVKSTKTQVDVKILRELLGVMGKVKSEFGLLVSWSGFNTKVLSEAKDQFLFIRLWTADDILDNIFKYYDNFSDEFKAELRLKRFWILVDEED